MNASSPTAEPRGPNRRMYTTTKTSTQRTTMASHGTGATSVARMIAAADAITQRSSVMRCAPRLGSADRRARHHRDLAADDGEEHGIAVRAAEREQEQRGRGERERRPQCSARREAAGIDGGEALAKVDERRSGLGGQRHCWVAFRVSRAAEAT